MGISKPRKVTPTHDLSWYVKWASTVLIMLGLTCRATGFSTPLDLMLSFYGTVGWCLVGYLWRDRALMVLNSLAAFLLLITLIKHTAGA